MPRKLSKKTGVSVVIPGFNDHKMIGRLIASIKKSTYGNIEIVVADNSTDENLVKRAQKKYKNVKWVDVGRKNLGQAIAYNVGFANAKKGNHILYCDSDVVLDPELIKHLVDRLDSDPTIGIVTPMILYLDDKNWVNQAGAEVNLWTGRARVFWGPKKDHLTAKPVQGSGTVMLFSNRLMEKIGGFEDWFMCYFDPEFCVRAERAGFTNWYEPKAVAYHDMSKDPKDWRPRVMGRSYLLGRNRTLFMRKHGNLFTYTLFLPLLLGYYFVESIKFKMFPKWLDLIKGTVVGYFYPLDRERTKILLPKI